MDSVLKKFNDVSDGIIICYKYLIYPRFSSLYCSLFQIRYKEKYENEVKGHYVGSYEDVFSVHCQKVEELKKDVSYPNVHMRIFPSSWLKKNICVFTFAFIVF